MKRPTIAPSISNPDMLAVNNNVYKINPALTKALIILQIPTILQYLPNVVSIKKRVIAIVLYSNNAKKASCLYTGAFDLSTFFKVYAPCNLKYLTSLN